MELTYHGIGKHGQPPKVHYIERDKRGKRYRNLLEVVLPLDHDLQRLVPIFSLNSGYAWQQRGTECSRKKAHVFKPPDGAATQLDFWLSSGDLDLEAMMSSDYALSLFFSFDHLVVKKRCELVPAMPVAPIKGFHMRKYAIWVRCSTSQYQGRPMLQFYRNASSYEKFMNRRSAWPDSAGGVHWSTLQKEQGDEHTSSGPRSS